MNRKASVLDIIVALVGLLFSLVILNVALVSIQASSGDEPLTQALTFFVVSFALAFGLGAACTLPLGGRFTASRAAIAFAVGGAVGGAILAGSLRLVDLFEPALRALTGGGPIGHFLLLGVVGALAAPIAVGTWLLRRMTGKASAPLHGQDARR